MARIVLSNCDVALFASDMHLGDHDPGTATLFLEALQSAGSTATHVFLLGDLFEAWVGDDQPDIVARAALALFGRLTATGCRIFAMRGNRDFLLNLPDGRFSALTGAVMLDDPCAVTLFDEPVVLAHGDALCIDDADYQRVRALVRGEAWQNEFLARPLDERLAIALALRAESEGARARRERESEREFDSARAKGESSGSPVSTLADIAGNVNRGAVDDALRAACAATIIHGHIHRPACHEWLLDGRRAWRWVLPDWDAGAGRGAFLRVDAQGFSWQAACASRIGPA